MVPEAAFEEEIGREQAHSLSEPRPPHSGELGGSDGDPRWPWVPPGRVLSTPCPAHVRRVCCLGRPGVRAAPSFQIVPREGPGDTARRGTSLARGHQLLMLSWATRPWPPAPQRGRAHWGFCRLFPSVLLRGLGTGAECGPRADGAVREGAGSPRQRTDPSIWDPVVTVPDN